MSNSAQPSESPNPSSSSKRKNLSSTEQDAIDRISQLPDFVLSHILSFLPIKMAAATSILSRGWRFLWIDVLNIDFGEVARDFEDMVSTVLRWKTERDCCIKKFRLHCIIKYRFHHLDTWVRVAIARGVEELDLLLTGCYFREYEFTPNIFTCNTLVVLKLSGIDILLNVPSTVHLPNLKVLHLLCVQYEGDHSVRRLFSGCPVLEDLNVERGDFDFVYDYEICSPTLINLVLDLTESDFSDESDLLARFNTAHLKNLCSLVNANINLYQYTDLEDESYVNSVDVLRAIYNVKFMELSKYTMKALYYALPDAFPTFHNLIRLKVDVFCCFYGVLQQLIYNSPCLEHLTFIRAPSAYRWVCEECERWMQPLEEAPKCLSFHLSTFCFEGFNGSEDDMECARYVLENSLVLENMEITCCQTTNLNQQFAIKQKLEMFERGSNKCQLKFTLSKGQVDE